MQCLGNDSSNGVMVVAVAVAVAVVVAMAVWQMATQQSTLKVQL